MDTSETYIKMRLVAIPDLGMGNSPSVHNHHIGKDVWVAENGDFYYFTEYTACQLERQDQLQEMVIDKSISGMGLCYDMWKFIESTKGRSWLLGYSMEQLWLAFVMKEKYNKVWDGEKWLIDQR